MSNLIPLSEVKELAKAAASSGFFPGVKSAEQALVLMAIAQSEGLSPVQALMRFDVIDGKPAKKAQAMLADFLAAGGKVQWHRHDDECADATFTHPQGGEVRVKWDIEKARKAGLAGRAVWQKFPGSMLHARCVSSGVRFVYPAATGGFYEPGEATDIALDRTSEKPAVVYPVQETPPTQQPEPVEAEIVEPVVQQVVDVLGGTVRKSTKLAVPGNDCDRIPDDVAAINRSLLKTPFVEMDPETLAAQISTLEVLSAKAKDPDNRAALMVVIAFAKKHLGDKK